MTRPASICTAVGADKTSQTSSSTRSPDRPRSPERVGSDEHDLVHPARYRATSGSHLGTTTIFGMYRHDERRHESGHLIRRRTSTFWQGGVVQHIDAAAMDFYAIYQQTDGDAFFDQLAAALPRRNVSRHLQDGHRWRSDPILILLPLLHLPRTPKEPPREGWLSWFSPVHWEERALKRWLYSAPQATILGRRLSEWLVAADFGSLAHAHSGVRASGLSTDASWVVCPCLSPGRRRR